MLLIVRSGGSRLIFDCAAIFSTPRWLEGAAGVECGEIVGKLSARYGEIRGLHGYNAVTRTCMTRLKLPPRIEVIQICSLRAFSCCWNKIQDGRRRPRHMSTGPLSCALKHARDGSARKHISRHLFYSLNLSWTPRNC